MASDNQTTDDGDDWMSRCYDKDGNWRGFPPGVIIRVVDAVGNISEAVIDENGKPIFQEPAQRFALGGSGGSGSG